MKKLVLIILLILTYSKANQNNFNQYLETDLKNFSIEVLSSLNYTFVIQDDLLKNITVYYKPNQNNFNFLKQVLDNNNYDISKINGTYFITKSIEDDIEDKEEKKVRYISLNFLNYVDIESICKLYDVNFTYLKETNKLAILSTYSKYLDMKEHIKNLDRLPYRVKLKLTVFQTDLGKVKKNEGLINFNLSGAQKSIFDIFLGSAINITNKNDSDNLKSVLTFLNSNSFSKNISSTIINLEHNKKYTLNSSQEVPYLITSNYVENTTTKEVNSYEYKDIGLSLSINPKILNNLVNLDLNFTNSQLLSNSDNLPVTSKVQLNQNITLTKKNKMFVLSGINNHSKISSFDKVPYLSDIPLLGSFFSNENIDNTMTTTTIVLELIDYDYLGSMKEVKTLLIQQFDSCKYLNLCD